MTIKLNSLHYIYISWVFKLRRRFASLWIKRWMMGNRALMATRLTLGAEREWVTACGKKVTLTGSSIWSADCQSIAGSHFLQTGEYFSGKENLKAEKKKVELFGLLLFFYVSAATLKTVSIGSGASCSRVRFLTITASQRPKSKDQIYRSDLQKSESCYS